METRGRGIEADVGGHPLFAEHVGKPFGGVVTSPRHSSSDNKLLMVKLLL